MYPFKFNPILKSTIWGGEKIIPFKHLNIEQPQVGESWEISNVPGDESVVANGTEAGKNLSQLVKEYKGSLADRQGVCGVAERSEGKKGVSACRYRYGKNNRSNF